MGKYKKLFFSEKLYISDVNKMLIYSSRPPNILQQVNQRLTKKVVVFFGLFSGFRNHTRFLGEIYGPKAY